MPSTPIVDRPAAAQVAKAAQVSVTVGPKDAIVCSPDPVNVKPGQTKVEFRIATPGYVFRQKNAIVVSNPGRDFPLPSVTSPDGQSVTLRDRRLDCGDYKYDVYLVEVSTGRVITVDPVIRNDPE